MEVQEIEVEFDYRLFNPLYWHIQDAFNNPDIRYIYLYGGSSAAKTYSLVQAITVDNLEHGNSTLVMRKYSTDIDDSIYNDFKSVASVSDDLLSCFTFQQKKIINNSDGSYIRFRGLDDSEKVKGVSQFKRVVLEELSQFDKEDFKQVRKRLRGMAGQQIVCTWNPISERLWVKKEIDDADEWITVDTANEKLSCAPDFVDTTIQEKRINKKGNAVMIRTTYLENYWVVGSPCGTYGMRDQHVIDDFEKDRDADPDYYEIYALGNYGSIRTGNEYYHQFKRNKHVSKVEYLPEIPTILKCWDFNVVPYMTLVLAQVRKIQREGKDIIQVRFFDEICLSSPFNSVDGVYSKFDEEYSGYDPLPVCNFYGDSTGKNRIPGLGDVSNYDMIEDAFLKYLHEDSRRILTRNTNPLKRKDFMNLCLSGKHGIEVIIDKDNCPLLIKDFEEVQLGPEGKIKKKVLDKSTNTRYEEVGHTSDAAEGLMCYEFWDMIMS